MISICIRYLANDLPRKFLRDRTAIVRIQQFFQIFNLLFQFPSDIGIPDALALRHPFDHTALGVDITLLLDRRLGGLKRIVRCQNQTVGVVNQRIPRDTGFFLICP